MSDLLDDEKFLRQALIEARKGVGKVSPNPAVGAVLVVGNQIVATGFHGGVGLPHAEVECLQKTEPKKIRAATLYVTLEPCSTTGRTPPCVDAIIDAGIKRVVIGAIDVNPAHRGRGVQQLRSAGIEVTTGVLSEECTELNEAFNKWIVTRRPFVIAKCGMSLDGCLTKPPNERHWLTGPAARRDAMALRATVDAVLIGAETLRKDNPRLTIRGIAGVRQPRRIVLSRSGRLPREARLFRDRFARLTTVYRNKSLAAVLSDLGRREITSVLIEGGGNVLGEAFDAGLVDKVQFYLAPLFTGGPVRAVSGNGVTSTMAAAHLTGVKYLRIGNDVRTTGYPRWAHHKIE